MLKLFKQWHDWKTQKLANKYRHELIE
jgi:hypothetical protein